MKHAGTGANYVIFTKQIKLQYEKNPASYLKSMQNVALSKQLRNLLRFLLRKNYVILQEKNRNGNHLSGHTGRSDKRSFDLYLINILTKSRESERYTDIMFKLAFYCLSVTVEDLNL